MLCSAERNVTRLVLVGVGRCDVRCVLLLNEGAFVSLVMVVLMMMTMTTNLLLMMMMITTMMILLLLTIMVIVIVRVVVQGIADDSDHDEESDKDEG